MEGHCQECDRYEAAVMAQGRDATEKPCPDYAMSGRFRDWLVQQMRVEVLGQVQAKGLDRMALLKLDEEE